MQQSEDVTLFSVINPFQCSPLAQLLFLGASHTTSGFRKWNKFMRMASRKTARLRSRAPALRACHTANKDLAKTLTVSHTLALHYTFIWHWAVWHIKWSQLYYCAHETSAKSGLISWLLCLFESKIKYEIMLEAPRPDSLKLCMFLTSA